MNNSTYTQQDHTETSIDVLSLFPAEAANAIRAHTRNRLARELNLTGDILQNMYRDPADRSKMSIRLFARRLHQFV